MLKIREDGSPGDLALIVGAKLTIAVPSSGSNIICGIDQIVQQIQLSPNAPQGFHEAVISVSQKYELNVPVVRSELDDLPGA